MEETERKNGEGHLKEKQFPSQEPIPHNSFCSGTSLWICFHSLCPPSSIECAPLSKNKTLCIFPGDFRRSTSSIFQHPDQRLHSKVKQYTEESTKLLAGLAQTYGLKNTSWFDFKLGNSLPPLVVLVWLGSGTVRPRPRCSGLNKHVNFGVCLFLTGVRVVPKPSDTSTTIGSREVRHAGVFIGQSTGVTWDHAGPVLGGRSEFMTGGGWRISRGGGTYFLGC